MTGLGTLVNMAAILIGSGIGLLLKNGIPKRLQTTISSAVGLCVVFVGVTGAIKGLMNVSGTTFETKDTLVVVIWQSALPSVNVWIWNREWKTWGTGSNPSFQMVPLPPILQKPL
jgi:hypothetical protein